MLRERRFLKNIRWYIFLRTKVLIRIKKNRIWLDEKKPSDLNKKPNHHLNRIITPIKINEDYMKDTNSTFQNSFKLKDQKKWIHEN